MEKFYGEGFEDDFDGDDLSGAEGGSIDEEEEDNGDEDVVDEDNEYLEFLAQTAANQSESEIDEFDDEIEEELLFESPLDEIDPYVRFGEVFKGKLSILFPCLCCQSLNRLHFAGLQHGNPASYTLLTKDLDVEQQNFILSIMSTAEERRKAQPATA